tara:strand:- start:1083 stop:1244 length:162 start_codon:yes stop_codon:yes gene_type:complete
LSNLPDFAQTCFAKQKQNLFCSRFDFGQNANLLRFFGPEIGPETQRVSLDPEE